LLPCRPLERPARARPTLRLGTWSLAALLLALAGPAHAFKLTSIRPARDAGRQLWVELRLEDPIEDRVAASLGRGMPATLTLHAELWRRRNGWFDRMERSVDATFRMHYEAWSDTWRLSRPGEPVLNLGSLNELELALSRTLALNVASIARYRPDVPCYVVVSASLSPLDIDDVEEVEAWLSGEVTRKKGGPFGFLTGIPFTIFTTARSFAGFGDQHSRLISADFTPLTLPPFLR
jgi:hypothetical protein